VLLDVTPAWLGLVLVLGLLAHMAFAIIFWWQLRHVEQLPVGFLFCARILFVGQIVRYLPGRIWHLVYQVSATHEVIPGSVLVRANLEYMSVVTWTATGISMAILLLRVDVGLAVASGLCTIATLVMGVRYAWHLKLFGSLASQMPKGRPRELLCRIGAPSPRELSTSLVVAGALSWFWSFYIGGWVLLGSAWPALAELDLVYLCAVYTLAWFVGFITMITPGGIGVRELAFALMASEVPAEILVLLMLALRVWLTLVEVLLFFAVLPVRRGDARND
jgi:hypothetical protein